MTVHEVEDESFLSDLVDFFKDCNDFEPSNEFPSSHDATSDLLVDSNELLAETEALLASYSANSQFSRANTPPTTGNTPVAVKTTKKTSVEQRREIKNAQAAKRRLKYRTKLKNERQTLREEEKCLSEELKYLQHARKKAKSLKERSVTAPMWQALATRQMEGRVAAEDQQRLLKKAVAHRSQVIMAVGEMMRQRLCTANVPAICATNEEPNSSELNADDVELFEDYLQDLDAVYSRTDEMFEACGIEDFPVMPYTLGPERKQDGDVGYIENVDVLLFPFTFEQTCSAMWESMVRLHRQQGRHHYAGVIDLENTFAVKFHLQCPREDRDPVKMMVHLVMRRYLEAERMILVWRALSEGEGEFRGMHSDETGWCAVRPIDQTGNEDSLFQTMMQTFVRFIPMNVSNSYSDEAEQFTKLVVASVEEDAGDIARMMDSLLLNDLRDEQSAQVVSKKIISIVSKKK